MKNVLVEEGDLYKAALPRNFELLAIETREQNYIKLAKNCCPPHHAQMASILLTELGLQSEQSSSLNSAMSSLQFALDTVKIHLGEHHPYHLTILEGFTGILQTRCGDTAALWEALRIRQKVLADASKILGKTHNLTRSQYQEVN